MKFRNAIHKLFYTFLKYLLKSFNSIVDLLKFKNKFVMKFRWSFIIFNVKDIFNYISESSDSSNTLLPNFNLDFLYDYLNSLTLLQESAVFHIAVLLFLGFIIFDILAVLLGNEIIKYFKLEEKYPKLAGIFRLRLKFQKYYLIYNFFLMYLIITVAILLNLLVLYKF